MSLNLMNVVEAFLNQNPEKRFTAREIANWIFENHTAACREKQLRSSATINPLDNDVALIQQLVAEISSQRPRLQKKNPKIKTTESRPTKYYYTESSDELEVELAEDLKITKDSIYRKEAELYEPLREYLFSEFQILSKRIDEKRSSNSKGSGGNKWLFPDLVGMEDLSKDWHREIKDCVREYADKKTKLWSFEVKVLINRSNVREVFFQTVSNSSWANFGYLVASEIQGADTVKELRILSGLHGIGVIRFDVENPMESQIVIPCQEKTAIDWDTANRLAEENTDFIQYVKLIRQFYQTGESLAESWKN